MEILTPIPHNLKRIERVPLAQKITEKERKKKQRGEAMVERLKSLFEDRRKERNNRAAGPES